MQCGGDAREGEDRTGGSAHYSAVWLHVKSEY